MRRLIFMVFADDVRSECIRGTGIHRHCAGCYLGMTAKLFGSKITIE